jgi:hypothetical protein
MLDRIPPQSAAGMVIGAFLGLLNDTAALILKKPRPPIVPRK